MYNHSIYQGRFCNCGPIMENFHMIDLFLYDSSLFANSVIVEDSDVTVIVDAGTSFSAGALVNYMKFNEINTKNVLIVPTHHHFDHTGGIMNLIKYLTQTNSEVSILANSKMMEFMMDPSDYKQITAKSFSKMMGELDPIPEKYFIKVDHENTIKLGDYWTLKNLKTPGHCIDHVSPLFTNSENVNICVFGEALGINLKRGINPIPASSAPCFKAVDYIESMHKLSKYRIDSGVFSHFGGIEGEENVKSTIANAILMYEEFKRKILFYYELNPKTKFITDKIFSEYTEDVATHSLNPEVARSLTFTIVYGILKDQGLK